ncbi:hypothetical protein AAFC00_002387 [Neodothiora populina]
MPAGSGTAFQSGSNSTSWVVGIPVNTTSGQIVGHPAPVATNVSEYLAIPYAQPPVGNLRFAAPQSYTGSGIINSTSMPLNCPQPAVGLPGLTSYPTGQFIEYLQAVGTGSDPNTNEDCLFLNVWTKPQSGEKKKAVMIWFYPGGFRSGGINNQGYSGQYYAEEHDVIVVAFNYRVAALGFSGAPGLVQNVGLLDQRLAVEWVRDNIAAFGGDVDRITLWGESAGAASIDYYNYAWTHDPIIAGTIMESGSTNLGGAISSVTATTLWNSLVFTAGCMIGSNDQQLACMRTIPVADLIGFTVTVSGGGYAFNPVVDNKIVFQDYTSLQSQGAFIQKPALVGSNENEAAWFKLTKGNNQPEAYYTAVTLSLFTCVTRNLATIRKQFTVPAWRYRFYPTFPDTTHPYNSTIAMHTSEVPLVWGTYDVIKTVASTAEERSLSAAMMAYWAAFVKNPTSGLTAAGWPVFDPSSSSKSLALFGYNNDFTNVTFTTADSYDNGCSSVKAYCS